MERPNPPFDLQRALDLVAGDGDLLVAGTQVFLEQNVRRLHELHDAVARQDAAATERIAHGLAGAAQSFAADDAERAARALLQAAAKGDCPALRSLAERMEATLTDLCEALIVHCTRHELRHVLVADDDDVTRNRLESLLTQWGHRVTAVSRGDVALEMLGPSGPPHIAIIDWMMPGLDGVEVCRALRARKSDTYTYVILITSKEEPEAMLAGLEAGADDFVAKPVAPEELRARLRAGQRIVELQERLIAAREEQRRHAERDGLTGVLSRRRLFDELEAGLDQCVPGSAQLSVALIDLDGFKQLNDVHGHNIGDRALRGVSARLSHALRRTDALGRYGGDEFVAVLPETSYSDALPIARRACDALASQPIECGEFSLRVTCSIGVASTEDRHADIEELLKRADRAMFRAKAAGGNGVAGERDEI